MQNPSLNSVTQGRDVANASKSVILLPMHKNMVEVNGFYGPRKCNDGKVCGLTCYPAKNAYMIASEMVDVMANSEKVARYTAFEVQGIQVVGAKVVPNALRCSRNEVLRARLFTKKNTSLACETSIFGHHKALGTVTTR